SSRSASSKTIFADFPPNSNDTGVKLSAAFFITCLPVAVSPTNARRLTLSFTTISVPTELPGHVNMFKTPAGNPASFAISPSFTALNGVYDAGLITIVFPAAKAAEAFQVICIKGKFQGIIKEVTPAGAYWV